MTVSSLNTYSSWEMAVASKPLPRTAVPVLVIRLGCEGNLSTISAARSAGGGGFEDEEAIVRLDERGALVGTARWTQSPSRETHAERIYGRTAWGLARDAANTG